jgi:SEC-C motif-containing protein
MLHQARLGLHPAPTSSSAPSRKTVGRNDPCPCGSGKKFKKCCLN